MLQHVADGLRLLADAVLWATGVALLVVRISHRGLGPISALTTRGYRPREVWRRRHSSYWSWGGLGSRSSKRRCMATVGSSLSHSTVLFVWCGRNYMYVCIMVKQDAMFCSLVVAAMWCMLPTVTLPSLHTATTTFYQQLY